MWRVIPHLFAADELVGDTRLIRVHRGEVPLCLDQRLLRLAGVAAEGDVWLTLEKTAKTLHLIVGQGVHGVQQQCTHTAHERSCIPLAHEMVENWYEKTLRLARASSG